MNTVAQISFREKAIIAHGSDCPDWITALADECDLKGYVKPVSARLGYSHSAVSAVINGSYTGRTERIREAVVACFLSQTVTCPIVGEISSEKCMNFQRRKKMRATDPLAIKLWRGCRVCPNRRGTI